MVNIYIEVRHGLDREHFKFKWNGAIPADNDIIIIKHGFHVERREFDIINDEVNIYCRPIFLQSDFKSFIKFLSKNGERVGEN